MNGQHPSSTDRSTVRILGISGGNRRGSYNTALLEAAKELLPENSILEIADVSGLPIFSQDLEHNPPPAVLKLKEKIKSADAILFATPEHNYSVTALLKNVIEWGDRPPGNNSWSGKPAAMVSASTGSRGAVRSQMHLRLILVDLNMHTLNVPQLYVGNAASRFDGDLNLIDQEIRTSYQNLLRALIDWTRKLRTFKPKQSQPETPPLKLE